MNGPYQTSIVDMALSTTNDFFQLRNVSSRTCEILEIKVFQQGETALQLNHVRIRRGDSGAAGTGIAEYKLDLASADALAQGFQAPTTNVQNFDLSIASGWNILQEFIWLPTPEYQIHLAPSDHLSLSLNWAPSPALNRLGMNIIWRERGAA